VLDICCIFVAYLSHICCISVAYLLHVYCICVLAPGRGGTGALIPYISIFKFTYIRIIFVKFIRGICRDSEKGDNTTKSVISTVCFYSYLITGVFVYVVVRKQFAFIHN
jgi:hypothetical protein